MIRNRDNAPHYCWGDGCDGWRLHEDDHVGVIEELVPVGGSERPHHHTHCGQVFIVLDGAAVMRLPDGDRHLRRGDSLAIAPGVVHQFRNDGAAPVRFLVITSPRRRWDRVDATPSSPVFPGV